MYKRTGFDCCLGKPIDVQKVYTTNFDSFKSLDAKNLFSFDLSDMNTFDHLLIN
jgi:hypothetical protein